MPWIETKITGTFVPRNGGKKVCFQARRNDGREWAASISLVSERLGDANVRAGVKVRIHIEDTGITDVQLANVPGQAPGVTNPTTSVNSISTGAPQAPAQSALNTRAAVNLGNSMTNTRVLPYGFVPINTEVAITDTPVWHDGKHAGELLSGEILCTLEALTPLLPGNARYCVRKGGTDNGSPLAKHTIRGILTVLGGQEPRPNKQIAEPLRLTDGRVVIPGTALKGMVRHSLGALLSAPMERVAERHYTYRPNLDLKQNGILSKIFRPGLVVANNGGGWDVEIFDDPRAAIFVRRNAQGIIRAASTSGIITGAVNDIRLAGSRADHQIGSVANLDHRVAIYKGGIDGSGLLAGTFRPAITTYQMALVPRACVCTVTIPSSLYEQYLNDQHNVLADQKIGHLKAHPQTKNGLNLDQAADEIDRNKILTVGQLIYLELETNAAGRVAASSTVLSFGHHFRYRWAYTSSVRKKDNMPRPCLTPIADERSPNPANGDDLPPGQLTGTRLLFGYVRDKDNIIGNGVYQRLAGRVAINHAVSEESDPVALFLGDSGDRYCVPLKILGQPKPSAWEFYLQQPINNGQPPATYGDLPGDAGGELRGRKFYYHQPRCQGVADIAETDPEKIRSDQATLARYICKPGTRFKFTLRFVGLRLWELGALLVTLQPHRCFRNGDPLTYALKLGLGRPLGMGSVRIGIDTIRYRCQRETHLTELKLTPGKELEFEQQAKQALINRIRPSGPGRQYLRTWANLHRYVVEGTNQFDYPRGTDGSIFAWHTELRKDYSQLRRQRTPDWTMFHERIQDQAARD